MISSATLKNNLIHTPSSNNLTTTKVYCSQDRVLPTKSFDETLSDASSWVDQNLNKKLVSKLNVPLEFCVDQVASCSKASFCDSASTNVSIDTSASASKDLSYSLIGTSIASLNLLVKSVIELFKFFNSCKFNIDPYRDPILERIHDSPKYNPKFKENQMEHYRILMNS
jgi:hypothetical protein